MSESKMPLPSEVALIFELLTNAGHRADIVGGCTRDFLLGKVPSDYDITTDATPEEMLRIFSEYKTVPTGIQHGTVSVIIGRTQYEITTYRVDGDYKDHRHPDGVCFTRSLDEDLARRDFTMNAICYNRVDGFTDRFGGIKDIESGVIRAVGNPTQRFREDALRILRAIRFSATLGFSIEKNTASAARAQASLLKDVSAERTYTEWKKLILGISALDVLRDYNDIIAVFIPQLKNIRLPEKTRFYSENFIIRICAIFALSVDDPSGAFLASMEQLKTDTKTKKLGAAILKNFEYCDTDNDVGLKKLLIDIGFEAAAGVMRLRRLLGRETDERVERLSYLAKNSVWRVCDLDIDGNDLIALGVGGAAIGKILQSLLVSVVKEECDNEKLSLLKLAKELKGV